MKDVKEFIKSYELESHEDGLYKKFTYQDDVKHYFSDHKTEINSKLVRLTARHDLTIGQKTPLVMDGFMEVLHIGTLTVEDGGYIGLVGNGALIVDQMDIKGEVGQPFMVISGTPNKPGADGAHGNNADAGPRGVDAVCDSPGVSGPPGSSGGTGGRGGSGANARNAGPGGQPSQMTVTFKKVTGVADLAIVNDGVTGGNGGRGGDGGNGGDGGDGGSAKICGWENANGGDGGNGGDGASSGNGGNGGSATAGGSLVLKIHQDDNITVFTECMIPQGGKAGDAGMVGNGGKAGRAGQYGVSGKAGGAGTQIGNTGQDGEAADKGTITVSDIKPGPPS